MGLNEFLELLQSGLSYPLVEVAGHAITASQLLLFVGIMLVFILLSRFMRKSLLQRIVHYAEMEEDKAQKYDRIIHNLMLLFGFVQGMAMMGLPFNRLLRFELFHINQTPITPLSILILAVLIGSFGVMSRLVQRFFAKQVFSYMNMDEGMHYTLSRIIHYLVMIIGGIIAFQQIGISLSGLAVVFGFLSVGIGFGLQNITSNFVAGLMLLFERPIQVGDRVVVGDIRGDVTEINIRSTTIRSENNISIIVPNSEFVSSTVVNLSHHDTRILLDVKVGVAYDSDLDLVIKALKEVAADDKDVLRRPEPLVHLANFGDSAWDMELRVWVRNPKTSRNIRSNLHCAIVRKFREYKIEIPFPQRDLNVRQLAPVSLSDNPEQAAQQS